MDLGTRWDDQRKLYVCDRTERSDAPPHGTLMTFHGGAVGWIAPKHWHPVMVHDHAHPVTSVRLRGLFYHEAA